MLFGGAMYHLTLSYNNNPGGIMVPLALSLSSAAGATNVVPPALSFSSAAGLINVNFGGTIPSVSTGLGGLPPNYNNNPGGTVL